MPQSSCSLFSSKLLYTREETNTSSSSILSNNSYQWYFLLFDVSSVTVRTELPKFDMHWLYSQPIKIGICIVVVCSVKVMDKSQVPYLSHFNLFWLQCNIWCDYLSWPGLPSFVVNLIRSDPPWQALYSKRSNSGWSLISIRDASFWWLSLWGFWLKSCAVLLQHWKNN